jgi:hypothetical protein
VDLGGLPLVYPRFNLAMFAFAAGRPDLTLREARRLWSIAPTVDLAIVEGEAARRTQQLAEELPRLDAGLAAYPGSHDLKTYVAGPRVPRRRALRAGATRRSGGRPPHDRARSGRVRPVLLKAAALEGDPAGRDVRSAGVATRRRRHGHAASLPTCARAPCGRERSTEQRRALRGAASPFVRYAASRRVNLVGGGGRRRPVHQPVAPDRVAPSKRALTTTTW